MKIRPIIFGLALVCGLGSFHSVAAEKDDFSISGFAGYYNTSSSVFIDSDAHFEALPTYGGAITYHFTPSFSIELSSTRYDSVMDVSYDFKYARLGKIEQTPLFYTVRYQFPIRRSNSHIYLGLGAGYYINKFDHLTRTELDDFFGVNVRNVDINNSVAYLVNVGTEMRLNKNFAMYLDLKAIFNQPTFDVVFLDGSADEKDVGMNASLFVFGVKYYF